MDSANHIPTWGGKAITLTDCVDRVELYVLCTKKDDRNLCGPRVLPAMAQHSGDSDFYKVCANIPKSELTTDGGCDNILELLKDRRAGSRRRSRSGVISGEASRAGRAKAVAPGSTVSTP